MPSKQSRTSYQKKYREDYKTKTRRVGITLSHSEYKAFEKVADKEKTKVTSLIKNMATAYLQQKAYVPKSVEDELISLKFLIRNIANNINQVTHHSHIMNELVNENDLLSEIKKLETIVNDYTLKQLKKSNDY